MEAGCGQSKTIRWDVSEPINPDQRVTGGNFVVYEWWRVIRYILGITDNDGLASVVFPGYVDSARIMIVQKIIFFMMYQTQTFFRLG